MADIDSICKRPLARSIMSIANVTPQRLDDGNGDDLDGYLQTRDVEALTTYCRRWLFNLVKAKKFPPPDIPGRIGSAHRWRKSTIRRALDEMQTASAAGVHS